jgi:putative ABC transport system permease protein
MILGEWRAHPVRVVTAAVAIAIGVALGFAVHLVNASALNEFSRALSAVNGEADLQLRARSPLGFGEGLYPRAARLSGVAAASPVVELPASAGKGADLTLIGLDALRAAAVTPALMSASMAADPFDEATVALSPAALAAAGAHVGDQVTISAAGRAARFRVSGVLPGAADGRSLAVIDIAAAQARFGQLGRLQRIDLRLQPGVDPARVRAQAAAILPPDAEVATPASQSRRGDALSRAYRVNLEMLGLVALLTGAFLVYSAQSLSVARRRPQFALLRVLGAPGRAVVAQVIAEAAVVGLAGALGGLLLGLGLAEAALRLLGGDLGGGYFGDHRPDLVFAPVAAGVFLALGLAAAVLGSLLPALSAARAQPAQALKSTGDASESGGGRLTWTAPALLAAGAAAAFAPAIAGVAVFGYVAIALLLAGGVAAMPFLARRILAPLQGRAARWPAVDLALKRLWGAPSQAALALCGIVASTSLMIAMAVMVTSFRGSVVDWLDQILPDDLYLRVESGGGFDRDVQARLAATPGVAQIRFRRVAPVSLAADRPPVALMAGEIGRNGQGLPLIGRPRPEPAGAVPVWVSEPAHWIYGWRAGDRIVLPLGPGGRTQVAVAGVWRDYARQQGAIAIRAADYQRLTGDGLRTEAAITLAPGADPQATGKRLKAALPAELAGRTTVGAPRQIKAVALQIFDRSFVVTYVLEAIAILVGLAGAAAAFAAQTLARTREFGMLRHIGVRRGQIGLMLATEGALLGALGAAAGIGLGFAMSQVLIQVVNPQSFHWTMQTKVPWGLLAAVAASLAAASAGTALLAGRSALSTDSVRAVREDW